MDHPPLLHVHKGNISLVVTRDPEEIRKAQSLRYRIFFEEIAGVTPTSHENLDCDEYDELCDHVIVYDQNTVIGTYRFLRPEYMKTVGKYYTQSEFDLDKLLGKYSGNVVEVGRSCIDPAYRTGSIIKLLWGGITLYLETFNIDLMFGCASFPGDDPSQHAHCLSYLHHFHRINDTLCPTPLEHVKASFELTPKDNLDEKQSFSSLPPLIKGYLRLGGKVGTGAVIDSHVNTTDVCIIVDKKDISQRYLDHLMASIKE